MRFIEHHQCIVMVTGGGARSCPENVGNSRADKTKVLGLLEAIVSLQRASGVACEHIAA